MNSSARGIPFNPDDEVNELIIVHTDDPTVDDARFEQKVTQLADAIRSDTVVVHDFYETHDPALISRDLKAVLITVGLVGDAEADVEGVIDAVQRADEPRLRVSITGEWTTDHDLNQLSQDDLQEGELKFGLPAALDHPAARLRRGRGRPRAGADGDRLDRRRARPHRAARPGVRALDLHREHAHRHGPGARDRLLAVRRSRASARSAVGARAIAAIDVAGATASRAVVFSGLAFVLAMFGMVLVPDTILRSLATGAILVGIVSVLAALTLLPALLGLLGDRVNASASP